MNGAIIALISAAAGMSASYGESLLDAMHLRHPEISGARILVTTGDAVPVTIDRRWSNWPKTVVKRPLRDANGNEIGTVIFQSRCSRLANAGVVATELSRRIYTSASLTEPDPFVAGAMRAPAAQAMIDDALSHDPLIITLAFHVTPPGQAINSIVASNFGRIGKPADSDDAAVMQEGKTRREITNNGRRVAIELPFLDSHRQTIGALSTSFKLGLGDDTDQMESRAISLRDGLARRIRSLKALFRPATASRQVGTLRACR